MLFFPNPGNREGDFVPSALESTEGRRLVRDGLMSTEPLKEVRIVGTPDTLIGRRPPPWLIDVGGPLKAEEGRSEAESPRIDRFIV